MQHRRVRLGDVLDDYCPRERRITNHAVVAMIEDEVKRTRCTTCDAEHEYKQAKVPPPRQKKKPAVPTAVVSQPADPPALVASEPVEAIEPVNALEPVQSVESVESAEPQPGPEDADVVSEATGDAEDEWPVHRPLIRATLPRPEGQAPERKAPDFTIRQGGRFDGERNGNRARGGKRSARHGGHGSSGQSRFGSPQSRSGQGQGSRHGGQHSGNPQRHGNRPGPASGRPHGGRHGGGGGQGRGPKRGR